MPLKIQIPPTLISGEHVKIALDDQEQGLFQDKQKYNSQQGLVLRYNAGN